MIWKSELLSLSVKKILGAVFSSVKLPVDLIPLLKSNLSDADT